jgi:hypothetical protein
VTRWEGEKIEDEGETVPEIFTPEYDFVFF